MPEAKTLAVGVAILTILGMTIALAVPLGPSIAGDDDPENSGVTSAQEDPVNNDTNNESDDNSTDTDNDGDDDDPEDNDGSGDDGSSDSPPCESNGDSSDSSGESDCDSDDGTDDQDGEKNKDDDNGDDGSNGDNGDGADDQDGEKDKDGDDNGDDGNGGTDDDGNNGNETDGGEDGENGTDVIGTCEENGLVMNNTIANEAFGTENESGPISEQLHENEEQFQDASVIVHEGSCVVATVDNNANDSGGDGDDGGPTDQLPGGDNGSDDGGDGSDGNGTDDGTDGNETDDGTGDDGELGTCETGGAIQDNTLANEIFGTENEDGPISSSLHENEEQFQDGEPIVHEGSCVVATVDNNANSSGDDGSSDQLAESP